MRKRKNIITQATAALPLEQCLAKTFGDRQQGRKVTEHCQIVGEVAKELISRMPQWLRDDLFPEGSELIASAHDLGKVSPTFQEKIYRGTNGYKWNSKPELAEFTEPKKENEWGGHAGVSFVTADELDVGRYIPEILGQHHGYFQKTSKLANNKCFGGRAWQQRREELLAKLKELLKCDFPKVKTPEQVRVLAGLTSVADWIGSSSRFDNPKEDWQALSLVEKALDEAGFIKPQLQTDLKFSDIFPFQANDIQLQLTSHCHQQGVYVLEAPMGIGKTEAALYAAYKVIASGQATGLYFALPTQLTSDKIHERVNEFLEKILTLESSHQKSLLLHGNAWLKKELAVEGNPSGSWFDNKKRGIIAPFAVGTIDQALMAVMNVKHGFVRAFGLAGKVVILDEVHSYDAYTGTILDELVAELRKLHCTVIILTATLTTERRQALINCTEKKENKNYPLISAFPKEGKLEEIAVAITDNSEVTLKLCCQDDEAIEEALERAELGQQVLWIENTVAEAQAKYSLLATRASEMAIECGLLHSRFTKTDRQKNENYWVLLYGKDNPSARQEKGRILIGTQVLEQSLDIDADFLISRFAPTDMLLQRLGRLWRHKNSVRPVNAQREAWLLVPELKAAIANAEEQFGKTACVYSPYVLCRSLEVWYPLTTVTLPYQIRELIEATYSKRECEEQEKMRDYYKALEASRKKLRMMALGSVSKTGTTDSDDKASTRYSEQDTVQVLLLKSYTLNLEKAETIVTLLDKNEKPLVLSHQYKKGCEQERRNVAMKLLQSTVQVAEHRAPQAVLIDSLKSWLGDYIYLGDSARSEYSLLRIAIVDESEEIKGLNEGVASENYQLSYNSEHGYQENII